ncbi:MAG: hypothetical protein Q4P11_06490 [Methanobrevibacter sp.]|nr:hypothetical protein [Methanobrevibacter sp.]
MYDGIKMNVSEGLERNGIQIQRILDNYFFIDPCEKVFDLMEKNYFFDFLEDAVEIVKGHYDEFKIYLFDVENESEDSIVLVGFVFCKENSSNSESYDSLRKAFQEFSDKVQLIESLFLILPIDDDEDFKKAYAGELYDR